jgi:hypothetical protein
VLPVLDAPQRSRRSLSSLLSFMGTALVRVDGPSCYQELAQWSTDPQTRTGPGPTGVTVAAFCGGCGVRGSERGDHALSVASMASRRAGWAVAQLARSRLPRLVAHTPYEPSR